MLPSYTMCDKRSLEKRSASRQIGADSIAESRPGRSAALSSLLALAVAFNLVGCTMAPVDPAAAAKIKSITVTRVVLPEYSYLGLDGEAAAKSAGVVAGYVAFGVLGLAAGDTIRAQTEAPYRAAIKGALSVGNQPSFDQVMNQEVEKELKARGVHALFVPPPPRLLDDSGYDFTSTTVDGDILLEIYPLQVGFSYQSGNAAPMVDVRWRLLAKYPGGKLVETHRGSVVHRNTKTLGGPIGEAIPANPEYLFKGQVTDLRAHGEKPIRAMQELASRTAHMIVERAHPVPVATKQ